MSMSSGEIRAAKALADAVREGTYWQAGAQQASYVDAREVVRLWRDARRFRSVPHFVRFERDWPKLVKALDGLADGWMDEQ